MDKGENNIKISRMKKTDINIVAEYMSETLTKELGESWTKETSRKYIEADYKYNNQYFLVARENGLVIGGLAAVPSVSENGNDLYISMIVVKKDKRGKGIGKKLFDKTIELARKNGLKGIRLLGHPRLFSLAWYHKLGFKETGWLELKKYF